MKLTDTKIDYNVYYSYQQELVFLALQFVYKILVQQLSFHLK